MTTTPSLSDRVRAIIESSAVPLTARQVAGALYGEVTPTRVKNIRRIMQALEEEREYGAGDG